MSIGAKTDVSTGAEADVGIGAKTDVSIGTEADMDIGAKADGEGGDTGAGIGAGVEVDSCANVAGGIEADEGAGPGEEDVDWGPVERLEGEYLGKPRFSLYAILDLRAGAVGCLLCSYQLPNRVKAII